MYCFARSVFVQWCARDVQLQRSWLVFGIFALDFVNFVVVKLMAHSIDGNDIREAKWFDSDLSLYRASCLPGTWNPLRRYVNRTLSPMAQCFFRFFFVLRENKILSFLAHMAKYWLSFVLERNANLLCNYYRPRHSLSKLNLLLFKSVDSKFSSQWLNRFATDKRIGLTMKYAAIVFGVTMCMVSACVTSKKIQNNRIWLRF